MEVYKSKTMKKMRITMKIKMVDVISWPRQPHIKFISYGRRSSRSSHDIEFVHAISDGAHEVSFGDRSANRLT